MKNKKIIILILAIILLILGFFIIFKSNKELGLRVSFLNVGQGDASFLALPEGQTVLIDGGPDKSVLRELGKILPWYRRRLDYVILSHYHDDHLFGLHEVLRRYRVGSLIIMPANEYPSALSEILATAVKRGVKIEFLEAEANLNFSENCGLNLLNPLILGVKNDENNSIISQLDCAGKRFLFSGDNELAVEKALLASGRDLSVDVFKASHHGSKTSNTEDFLHAINPQYFIISLGKDNKFGHPSPEVVARAQDMGLNIRRSDQDGTTEIVVPIR